MKKLLALVLSLLLVASCFALSISAEDTTEGEDAAYTNTVLKFDAETMKMKVLTGQMGISKPVCNTGWEGARLKLTDVGDPYVTIQFNNYIRKAGLEDLDSQTYPFVAIKVVIEGYVEDIELFICAGDVLAPDPAFSSVSDYPCESSGEAEYVIYDLTDDCEGIYNSFRFDPMGADEDTVIYLCEIAFFATEDEALIYAGYGEDGDGEGEDEETTEESVEETEEQTEEKTEKKTEKETTKAQKTEKETEAAEEGCGGIISIGAVVAMISLGIVCIKKKD